MNIKFMPNEKSIIEARMSEDPLLILISHNGNTVIMGNIDIYGEHILLLKNAGWDERSLDEFFRVIASNDGTDWTFVVPQKYKNIQDRENRIEAFYNDGVSIITKVLSELQLNTSINMPDSYKR